MIPVSAFHWKGYNSCSAPSSFFLVPLNSSTSLFSHSSPPASFFPLIFLLFPPTIPFFFSCSFFLSLLSSFFPLILFYLLFPLSSICVLYALSLYCLFLSLMFVSFYFFSFPFPFAHFISLSVLLFPFSAFSLVTFSLLLPHFCLFSFLSSPSSPQFFSLVFLFVSFYFPYLCFLHLLHINFLCFSSLPLFFFSPIVSFYSYSFSFVSFVSICL